MNAEYLPEPFLFFGKGKSICPREGITGLNVYDTVQSARKDQLLIGIVGVEGDIENMKCWLKRFESFIPANPKGRQKGLFKSFPGFNQEQGFCARFIYDTNYERVLSPNDVKKVLGENNHEKQTLIQRAVSFVQWGSRRRWLCLMKAAICSIGWVVEEVGRNNTRQFASLRPRGGGATFPSRRYLVAVVSLLVALPLGAQPPAPKPEVRAGGTKQELFRRAEEHYFNKKYHTSAELFRRVVAEQPEHLQAHAYLGDIYLMDREPDRALTHIRIAIELSPEPAREYFRLGQALYLKKDADGALAAYARAYAADPKLHEVHFQTGMVHLYLRRDAKATVRDWTQFRKLVPADPQGPDIDKAIRLLSDPQFKFPGTSADPCLPGPSESRVPDRAPPSAKTKEDNKSKDIIPVDEL